MRLTNISFIPFIRSILLCIIQSGTSRNMVMAESRVMLKLMLGGLRVVSLPILMHRLNENESAFLKVSLFFSLSKRSFFTDHS